MSIGVIGAGAFGTALAVIWTRAGRQVSLWGRNADQMAVITASRTNARLPGVLLPDGLDVTPDLATALTHQVLVLALPAQTLRPFLAIHAGVLSGKALVAACKGIDLATMTGPVASIRAEVPEAQAAILTGPSFAADIARGLPTALTLASDRPEALQQTLSTSTLRLYRSTDTAGAELGGALKNVMAIACGACIGAGLGESARAALMTRGFAEMQRLALRLGAKRETLAGLSGFGDLTLTCTSDQSRNYRLGLSLGQSEPFAKGTTVEGAATARAVRALARKLDIEMPICTVVADMLDNAKTPEAALDALLSRPLKEE